MSLDTALKNFANAFHAGSENLGVVEYRAEQAIVTPIPLGAILADYYARLHLDDRPHVGGELMLMLFGLDKLEIAQYGWRWIRDRQGPVTENPAWDPHWIVIADRNGDALIVDDSTAAGTVFGNIGANNFKIADDLVGFFKVMAEAMTAEATTFNYEVVDEDFNPTPLFLDEVRAIAHRHLDADGEAGFMKFFFG